MHGKPINSLTEAFAQAMRWEAMAEKFYHAAAEKFAGTNQQLLLLQLAEEEASHQLDIKRMANQMHEIDQEYVSAEHTETDDQRMREILGAGNMLDVARFALEMENTAVANYARLAAEASGDLKSMLLEMQAFEERHVEMIENMLRDLDIDPSNEPEEIYSH